MPTRRLLGPKDPAVVNVAQLGGRSPILLVGDHAGRAVPERLGDMGVSLQAMDRHIAWDIGVAGMGAALAPLIDAPFINQAYSRLVIDCNRKPGAPDRAPEVSDGTPIPANVGLSAADLASRVDEIYRPYQEAIAAELDARATAERTSLLVSLHSFTPRMGGLARPWKMGVLHRNDSVLSSRMLELLQAELGQEATGDNQPYAMDPVDNTVPLHADARGLDYLELEVRQDLIADAAGQAWAAHLIARLLTQAIKV